MPETEFKATDFPFVRPATIVGIRSFRYPREMTLSDRVSKQLAENAGETTTLRFVEGVDGEPFYFAAKVERRTDGSLRLYDITPSPTAGQRDVEFEPSE
jgi:hypothetical protein